MGLPPDRGVYQPLCNGQEPAGKESQGHTDYTAEAAFLQGAAAAQEGAYRDLVGSLNISVEEMKRMLRDCLPR